MATIEELNQKLIELDVSVKTNLANTTDSKNAVMDGIGRIEAKISMLDLKIQDLEQQIADGADLQSVMDALNARILELNEGSIELQSIKTSIDAVEPGV